MKVTLDLKSLLIGSILTVFVLLALGAKLDSPPQVDRFRIVTSSNYVFVIDTATGQVWGEYVVQRQDMRNQEFMTPRMPLDKK